MNLIFKTRFGSHLYGTNTPNSDTDYKGVYIAPIEDTILNKVKETIHFNTRKDKSEGIRNSKNDTDFEVIELRKFINDALAGQTYALDLLFTPLTFAEYYTDIWDAILNNRNKLLSKRMEPYIGYCRQQAAKYGLRGSRLGDIIKIIDYLKKFDDDAYLSDIMGEFQQTDFIKVIRHSVRKNKEFVEEDWWDIVGKKFAMNTKCKYVLDVMINFMDTYGDRARLAQKNEGIDWKAISHAYRCMYQLEEIADTGNLIFPLKKAEWLKTIKSGVIPYSEIEDDLPDLMTKVTNKVTNSKLLPNEPDYSYWDRFIISIYKNYG